MPIIIINGDERLVSQKYGSVRGCEVVAIFLEKWTIANSAHLYVPYFRCVRFKDTES